jgi:hypothetical protein
MTHLINISGLAFNRFFSSILHFALTRVFHRLQAQCGDLPRTLEPTHRSRPPVQSPGGLFCPVHRRMLRYSISSLG